MRAFFDKSQIALGTFLSGQKDVERCPISSGKTSSGLQKKTWEIQFRKSCLLSAAHNLFNKKEPSARIFCRHTLFCRTSVFYCDLWKLALITFFEAPAQKNVAINRSNNSVEKAKSMTFLSKKCEKREKFQLQTEPGDDCFYWSCKIRWQSFMLTLKDSSINKASRWLADNVHKHS